MKRDMDLARRILHYVEDHSDGMHCTKPKFDGIDENAVAYHVLLLEQGGLLEAADFSSHGGIDAQPVTLTWEGHEFLEASRDPTTWERAKSMAGSAGGLTFSVLKEACIRLIQDAAMKGIGP